MNEMTKNRITSRDRRKASGHYEAGRQAYEAWDIDLAIRELEAAVELDPGDSDYHLSLAQALARSGDYDQTLVALGEFVKSEPDSHLAERFEQVLDSGMDDVEQVLTDRMTEAGMPAEEIGAALQMWMEYQVALGREQLVIRKPDPWAAALDYIVRKVNLRPVRLYKIADLYGVSDSAVRTRQGDLIDTLDVMPCDYRYFADEENPLDKLVEAAELLEELEARFQES